MTDEEATSDRLPESGEVVGRFKPTPDDPYSILDQHIGEDLDTSNLADAIDSEVDPSRHLPPILED